PADATGKAVAPQAVVVPVASGPTAAPAAAVAPQESPATAPTAPAAATVQVGSVALPTAAATRETAAPLADQLAGKIAEQLPGLKAAGPGRHVLSLTVTPEHFGKVQVVAHIGPESVRVELVGATDAARDSLRAALPDLRRDLAQSGLSSDVQLGDPGSGSADDRGASQQATRSPGLGTTGTTTAGGDVEPESTPTVRLASAAGGLDLLV
uniref:flagellar hook-length control protein FliK n=1 Tax=Cellulomonas sp. RIT-PI-Y TaxID=3035297 RepID=UPI0021D7D258